MRNCRWLAPLIVSFAIAACAGAPNARELQVSPAIAGEMNTIDVASAGHPLSVVAIDMPEMRMPAKRYMLRPSTRGIYEASNVSFTMGGTWRVSVFDVRGKRVSAFSVAVR
jgi:hypothetical protein